MAKQNKGRKFFAASATAALVASAVVPAAVSAQVNDFESIPTWAQDAVNALLEAGVVQGDQNGNFNPNGVVTRAQAAQILYKALGLEATGTEDFSDVSSNDWFYDAVVATSPELFEGYNGQFSPNAELTREQAAKVIVTAFGLTGEADLSQFSDADQASSWATPYLEIAVANGILKGSNGKLNASAPITRAEIAVIVTRTIEAAVPAVEVASVASKNSTTLEVTLKTATTGLTAKDFKITVDGKAVTPTSVTADATGAKYTIVHADLNNTKGTVAVNGVTANFDYTTPKVESVSAINATQVEVKFNTEVDKTAAQTVTNYSIATINPASAALQADGKTVKLTFANASEVEVTNAVLVVEQISTKADTSIKTAKYTQVFTYEDKVNPEVVSVEAKTNGNYATSVTVNASEPIASAVVKINGEYKTVNFGGTDKATITGLSLDATKSHTIELINLTDKSGNITVSTSKTFNVEKDTVAPTVTLTAKSDKQIVLTFSKSMDVASVTAALAANSAVKDEAFASVNHNVAAVVADTDNKQFTIDVTSTLYTNKDSRTLTVVLPNTIKDSVGNVVATTTQQVTLTKDTTKPVATGYKVVKNAAGEVTDLEVTFSEELAANANPAEPTIVDANGVIVTLLGGITADAITAGDKKVTYSFTTPAKLSGVYNFSFPTDLVLDRAETANKSASFNYNVDFGTATGTFKVTSATAAANVITVVFPTAVKGGAVTNSATDLNNYTLAGKPLAADTTITLSADQKTATITLKAGSVAKTDTTAILTIANIKATNGDSLESYTGTVSVDDNTQPVLTTAVLNDNGSITLGFSETLTTATVVGDYTIRINNKVVADSQVTAITAGSGSEDGKYIIPSFVATFEDTDSTPSNGDEKVYIDVDGDGSYSATADVLLVQGTFANLAATAYSAGTVGAKDVAITSLTITTDASATGKDAKNNVIKDGTVITVK